MRFIWMYWGSAGATTGCLFLFAACNAMPTVEVEGGSCGAGESCPEGKVCVANICEPTCVLKGNCDDAGIDFEAGSAPTDDAGGQVDTGCATCDDSGQGSRGCDDDPCFDGVACTDLSGGEGFVCGDCPSGYVGNGVTCADIDGCADSPCFADVVCGDVAAEDVATIGAEFVCGECPFGYSGNGVTCADIDGCADSPCFTDVDCTDVAAADVVSVGTEFVCGDCPSGYLGNGETCADIDGCADSPCFADVGCTDVAAADVAFVGAEFTCGNCPSGYTGNGLTCTDIDECASTPCTSNQTCTNTAGSYTCATADCTMWDNDANAPCPTGFYNCDCFGQCGATSACTTSDPTWPPSDAYEIADFFGRYNEDRPTWYFNHNMSAYPSSFTVIVNGCATFEVTHNNGVRFEYGGQSNYVVKQSDVAGRGMALIGPASCQSERAYIR